MTISLTLTFILLFILIVVITILMAWWFRNLIKNAPNDEIAIWISVTISLIGFTLFSIATLIQNSTL